MNYSWYDLQEEKVKYGLLEKTYCSYEEKQKFLKMHKNGEKLPDDVFNLEYAFIRYKKAKLTEKETDELLRFIQLNYLKSINKGVVFFVVLTVISLILSMISVIRIASIF